MPADSSEQHKGISNKLDDFFLDAYRDLRRVAHGRLFRNQHLTLLDTTSLVHEAYIRLHGVALPPRDERSEVMAMVASVMRSVVVDCIRRRNAERRGGGQALVSLDTSAAASPQQLRAEQEALDLDEALVVLAQADPRLARVVELKYFGGFNEAEIAAGLDLSERTVRRDWVKARALLRLALGA
jgi:RNA polymerase sigma factor (TIGR02999 family)